MSRESEDSDPEGRTTRELDTDQQGISGGDDDAFIDAVAEELEDRKVALSPAYPFSLSANGGTLKLDESLEFGAHVYLFCLLLEHSKKGDILDGNWLPNVTTTERDLFQVCATLAAAGEVDGFAYSFGWPRQGENRDFLARLKTIYEKFGEGTVRESRRPGASSNPKDAEIDVIAWKPTPGNVPGTYYLLGQSASGNNWQEKSIKGAIDSFHNLWFSQRPSSHASACIFIPHAIKAKNPTDTRRDEISVLTERFGMIFDRIRLPLVAQRGFELFGQHHDGLVVERGDDAPKIEQWVSEQITSLRESMGC